MSNTIAHRPHVRHHHVPLLPVLAVIVAIIVATAVIWAINQPEQGTITTTGVEVVPAPSAGTMPAATIESPVFRHALMRMEPTGAEWQAFKYGRAHQVDGTTLDPVTTTPYGTGTYESFDNLR